MSEAWERVHRRHRLVIGVLDDVSRRGPEAIWDWRAPLDAEFGDLGAFLRHVRRRWQTHWAARMDGLLEEGSADRPDLVREAWAALDRDLPGVRLLLDAYADSPRVDIPSPTRPTPPTRPSPRPIPPPTQSVGTFGGDTPAPHRRVAAQCPNPAHH